jgi:GxxExxY protein
MNTAQLNSLSRQVIGSAIAVHRELGPGLDEADYEMALSAELAASGVSHCCQHPLPVVYKGVALDYGYRLDILVASEFVVELKSVTALHPIHDAQLLTYLRLANRKVGLLLNFDVPVLKQGIRRKVLGLDEEDAPRPATPSIRRPQQAPADDSFDQVSKAVLGAAIEVHRYLGPGLLKSAYEECLCHELSLRGLRFERQKPVAVRFRNIELPKPAEVDLIVAGTLPVMLASVSDISALLQARLIGLLKLGGWPFGLLLNFNVETLVEGVRRLVNPKFGRR